MYVLLTIYIISYVIVELDSIKRHKTFYFQRVWKRYDHNHLAFYFGVLRLILLFPLFALLVLVDV